MHFKKRLSYIAIKNIQILFFLFLKNKKQTQKRSHLINKCLYSLIIIKSALFLHIRFNEKVNKFSVFLCLSIQSYVNQSTEPQKLRYPYTLWLSPISIIDPVVNLNVLLLGRPRAKNLVSRRSLFNNELAPTSDVMLDGFYYFYIKM